MHSWFPRFEFNKQDKSPGDFHKHTTFQQGTRTRQSFCTLTIGSSQITKVLIKSNREISHVYKYSKTAILIFTVVH